MPTPTDASLRGRYAGLVEERIPGAPMHCHTVMPNHDCPQLRAGCLGCTFASGVSGTLSPWLSGALGLKLRLTLTADDSQLREALRNAK
jgi:hypothetical protein